MSLPFLFSVSHVCAWTSVFLFIFPVGYLADYVVCVCVCVCDDMVFLVVPLGSEEHEKLAA